MTVRSVLKNALNAIGRGLRAYGRYFVAHNKKVANSQLHSDSDQSENDFYRYHSSCSNHPGNIYYRSDNS